MLIVGADSQFPTQFELTFDERTWIVAGEWYEGYNYYQTKYKDHQKIPLKLQGPKL